MPYPDPAFETRMEYVRWVIVSALIRRDREERDKSGGSSGLTTTELVRALVIEDGAFTGSLRDIARQVRSEKTLQRQETRAAIATLLLDGMLVNPSTGRHPDVWRLSQTSLDRINRPSGARSEEWRLTREQRGLRMLAMKSSV